MRNVLKQMQNQIADFENFYSRDMVDFVLKILSELGRRLFHRLFENLIQKRKPVIFDNQLTRGVQSKSTRGHIALFKNLIQKRKPVIADNQSSRRIQSKSPRSLRAKSHTNGLESLHESLPARPSPSVPGLRGGGGGGTP